MPDWLIATILGIVEGLTEFVSVSPTGHLIVARELLGWNASIKDMFEVIIQVGAIIAILVVYQERFRSRVMLDHSLGTGDTRRLSIGQGGRLSGPVRMDPAHLLHRTRGDSRISVSGRDHEILIQLRHRRHRPDC